MIKEIKGDQACAETPPAESRIARAIRLSNAPFSPKDLEQIIAAIYPKENTIDPASLLLKIGSEELAKKLVEKGFYPDNSGSAYEAACKIKRFAR